MRIRDVDSKPNKPINILWYSNAPFLPTGFGRVTFEICKRLQLDSNFKVIVFTTGIKAPSVYNGVQMVGMHNEKDEKIEGESVADIALYWVDKLKADMFITLEDTFTLKNQGFLKLEMLKQKGVPFVMYTPFDGEGVCSNSIGICRLSDCNIAMAKFTKDVFASEGFDSHVIWHGVDLEAFHPVSEEKQKELKRKYGFDENDFVIFSYMRNSMRKVPQRQMEIACEFLKDKPNNVKAFFHIMNHNAEDSDLLDYRNRLLFRKYPEIIRNNRLVISPKGFMDKYGFDPNKAATEKEIAEYIQLSDICFNFSCLHENTDINTKDGIKPIKEINVEDEVLTSSGLYRKVLNVIPTRNWKGNMLTVKTNGIPNFRLTDNHKIYRVSRNKKYADIKDKDIILDRADTLQKGDYLLLPIPKLKETKQTLDCKIYKKSKRRQLPDIINLDYNFGLLTGYYLSEGCSSEDGLAFCFHTKEIEKYGLVEQILNNRFDTKVRVRSLERNRTIIWSTGRDLGKMFSDIFGRTSHEKKLPEWILDSPKEFRRGLMEGMWKGDGCAWKSHGKGNVFELQTVSKTLAHQLFLLLIAEGFIPTLKSMQRTSMVWKIRLNGNQNFSSLVDMKDAIQTKKKFQKIWKNNNYIFFPITKIVSNIYEGTVYDLTIEKEHNFCCNCLVKNSGEGYGLICAEGAACGKPVVATNYTTTKELLLDEIDGIGKRGLGTKYITTLTAGYNTTHAFADLEDSSNALTELYKDKQKRKAMGENGRKFAEKYLNWDYLVEDWKKIIRNVV